MIVYGKNVLEAVIKNERTIYKLFLQKGLKNPFLNIPSLETIILEKQEFIQKFGTSAQGIAAEIEDYKLYSLKELDALDAFNVIVLDGISDPYNFGAIIRSAKAFNIDAIIIRRDRSVSITPVVVKASAGTIETMKIIEVTNIKDALIALKEKGAWVYGLSGESDEMIDSIDFPEKTVLVLGSEGEGISRLVMKHCDVLVKIPMNPAVESLNVSVASAIACYTIFRKR